MRKNRIRYIVSASAVAFFLVLAVGSLDSNDSSSSNSDRAAEEKPSTEIESEQKVPQEEEPIIMYNSTEEENASDGDEEIVVIKNFTEQENASDEGVELIPENSSEEE